MATKKNLFHGGLPLLLWCAVMAGLTGCGPPGPRAFKEGRRLMEQGKYAPAAEQFNEAVRLMPTNAQAWNYLGLACQQAGQVDAAAEAYQKALKLNHGLIIVHYNLGCLWLEQNKPEKLESARNELTAYVLQQGDSLPGWLKRGTAELRQHDLVAAEKSFNKALSLSPDDAEAFNGLGLVEWQRNRHREAAARFNSALAHHPKYGPALLNLAVVSQTYLNNRPLALQKYQEYLALNPKPANWNAVNTAARQLELELNPPAHAATNLVAAVRPATNVPVLVATAVTNLVRPETHSNLVKTVVAPPNVPPARTEIVQVPDTPTVRVAANGPATNVVPETTTTIKTSDDMTPADSEKPGFLQRINPFRRDSKTVPNPTPLSESGDAGTAAGTPNAGPMPMARYTYVSPAKPADGNRAQAERLFAQAADAQHDHRLRDAVALYRAATQADPAYFEAQSNLGLAAYDAGDLTQSLFAYETALAIKPESFSARFNFALALRKAGYLPDAAQELERLLSRPPGESSAHLALAHLTLANLYADQFRRPAAARPHYLKVLELDPQNSEATAIRYWLRDNP